MYVHENDRREYVHAHDDDRGHVRVNVHACAHESECVHVCVLRAYVNEHVHVHDDDDVRARGDVHGHARGRDDDQSHQQCHGLFHHVPYAHRSLFPKYYFSRYGLHEDDNRRAKSS